MITFAESHISKSLLICDTFFSQFVLCFNEDVSSFLANIKMNMMFYNLSFKGDAS